MEPTLQEVYLGKTLVQRELATRGRGKVPLSQVIDMISIRPTAILTEDRARYIFRELFVSRREVTDALNVLFKKSMPFFRIEEEGEVAFNATEEQADYLAEDGNWVCLFLPDIPFSIVLELFRSLDVKYKEQWLRTLGNFVGGMNLADGHDFVNKVCPVGTRNAPGYVFLSRKERDELANFHLSDAARLFRFEKVAFANIWTIVLLQLALSKQLVRSCSYTHFKMSPDGGVMFFEKKPGDEKLPENRMLDFARPIG